MAADPLGGHDPARVRTHPAPLQDAAVVQAVDLEGKRADDFVSKLQIAVLHGPKTHIKNIHLVLDYILAHILPPHLFIGTLHSANNPQYVEMKDVKELFYSVHTHKKKNHY